MWILVSRGRPHQVERLLSTFPLTEKGIVAIDDDQTEMYRGITLPDNWSIDVSKRERAVKRTNDAFNKYPYCGWYGLITDDVFPHTSGWDSEMPNRTPAWGMSWVLDKVNGRPICVVMGGELVRSLGFLLCPVVKHFYADDAQELMATELINPVICDDIVMTHMHFTRELSSHDETYRDRPSSADDKIFFSHWKADEWPKIRDRVKQSLPVF